MTCIPGKRRQKTFYWKILNTCWTIFSPFSMKAYKIGHDNNNNKNKTKKHVKLGIAHLFWPLRALILSRPNRQTDPNRTANNCWPQLPTQVLSWQARRWSLWPSLQAPPTHTHSAHCWPDDRFIWNALSLICPKLLLPFKLKACSSAGLPVPNTRFYCAAWKSEGGLIWMFHRMRGKTLRLIFMFQETMLNSFSNSINRKRFPGREKGERGLISSATGGHPCLEQWSFWANSYLTSCLIQDNFHRQAASAVDQIFSLISKW